MENILAVVFTQSNTFPRIALEVLGCGKKLSEHMNATFNLALIGDDEQLLKSLASEAILLGVDKVYIGESSLLNEYQADICLAAFEEICKQANPDLIIFGGNDSGQELAPRLAHRIGAAIITDCTEVKKDEKTDKIVCIRPLYGGKASVILCSKQKVLVITVRPRSMDPAIKLEKHNGKTVVTKLSLSPDLKRTTTVEVIEDKSEGPKLDDAQIIVSGGHGIGGTEGFDVLKQLAEMFKGAVGASRAAVDSGWVPSAYQIGQTGKIVGPNLYFAVGISGASQHLAGIGSAKHIIAINIDPQAPIFRVARVGVIMDYRKFMPALIEKTQKFLSQ